MNIDQLLSHFEGIRKTSPTSWMAKCPAHDDRHPSLAILSIGDRTLLHCFAGCDTQAVVEAVGLTMRDLFYQPLTRQHPATRAPLADQATLEQALSIEMTVLAAVLVPRIAGREIERNNRPSMRVARPEYRRPPDAHWDREVLAARRIKVLLEELYQ